MTFVPFPDTVSLTHRFMWHGQEVSYGLHLKRPGYTATNAQLLADDAGQSWAAELAGSMVTGIIADVVTVQDLSETGAPNYENPDEIGETGNNAADGVPNNTSILISHRTADTGRSARGRTYFPGVAESAVVNGRPLGSFITSLATAWAAYIVDLEFQGWTFVVAQRVEDGAFLTQGVTREVTDEIFPNRLGTQRLRQAR